MQNSNNPQHPYTLEIIRDQTEAPSFRWVIRKNNQLNQRSDRGFPGELKARESGIAQIEKLLSSVSER